MESVGYRNTVFRTHHIYPDDLIMKLADAAVTLVANGSTRQDFLRFFGRCFVRYFSHYGYEKFIKVNKLSFSLFLSSYAAAVVCLPEIMKIKKQGSSCWLTYFLLKQTLRIIRSIFEKKECVERKKEKLRRYEKYVYFFECVGVNKKSD